MKNKADYDEGDCKRVRRGSKTKGESCPGRERVKK